MDGDARKDISLAGWSVTRDIAFLVFMWGWIRSLQAPVSDKVTSCQL